MTAQSRHVLEAEGTVVLGNGEVLRATEKLGAGSFGAVWMLQGETNSFALKETISDSDPSFQQTVSEAMLLMAVSLDAGHVGTPKYIGHEGARVGDRRWRMRLMMSLVPGEPLDQWMHRSGAAEDFQAAAAEVREMLTQMTAAMKVVEKFCVHRDISSHNIMIEHPASGRPKFCLIDLGLAVMKTVWTSKWREFNLAGDCKYWPPAAWLLFTYGPAGIRPFTPEANQYTQALDVFSLGVTCLELLMSRTPTDCPISGYLRNVWTDYWDTAAKCWREFYSCFKGQGDWEALRASLTAQSMPQVIMTKLQAVTHALDRLAVDSAVHSLLNTIRFMITPNSCPTDFTQVQLHLLNNVRTLSQAVYRPAHPFPGNPIVSPVTIRQQFRLPVLADYRTPFLPTRQINRLN